MQRHRGKRPLQQAAESAEETHGSEDVVAQPPQEPPAKKARTDELQGTSTAQREPASPLLEEC